MSATTSAEKLSSDLKEAKEIHDDLARIMGMIGEEDRLMRSATTDLEKARIKDRMRLYSHQFNTLMDQRLDVKARIKKKKQEAKAPDSEEEEDEEKPETDEEVEEPQQVRSRSKYVTPPRRERIVAPPPTPKKAPPPESVAEPKPEVSDPPRTGPSIRFW